MIDIILDCNDNNIFNNKEYNVEEVSVSIADNHEEYRKLAQQILAKHRSEENIIIKINNESISLNKLALALFIESIDDNKTNNVVFKVKDIRTSMEAYKPYIALTIGIKYALRLIKEDIRTSYKDMESLNYLGLNISRDYFANTITFKWQNSSLPLLSCNIFSNNSSRYLRLFNGIVICRCSKQS